jgi:hypothetical protein
MTVSEGRSNTEQEPVSKMMYVIIGVNELKHRKLENVPQVLECTAELRDASRRRPL